MIDGRKLRGNVMTKISRIVRVSTQGMSRPFVCMDADGCLFWCKGNHTGLRAIVSEWLCAKIAHAVGLPVPECCIARLEPTYFNAWRNLNAGDCPNIVTESNPYVFASRNVESAKDVINVAKDLVGVDALTLARIYLFDAFIRNADRTDYNSNLLVNHGVHVIDHNNAFDPAFDVDCFRREHVLRFFFARTAKSDLLSFEQTLRDTVTPSFLESVWSEMPAEWTDAGDSVLSLDEITKTLFGGCS